MNNLQSYNAPNQEVTETKKSEFVLDVNSMQTIMAFSEMMSKATVNIPTEIKGKPSDCAAIVMQALRWDMDPFAVASKVQIVNGKLGYESQLISAVVLTSGVIEDEFDYEFYGPWENVIGKFVTAKGKTGKDYQKPGWKPEDERGCGVIVSAVMKKSGKKKELNLLLSQAAVRFSTLWASDPKQQLGYLAVKRWTRRHTPHVLLGVYSDDEIREVDVPQQEEKIIPKSTGALDIPDSIQHNPSEKVISGYTQDEELIIQSIENATTLEHCAAIVEDCQNLGDSRNKDAIRNLFAGKKKAIKISLLENEETIPEKAINTEPEKVELTESQQEFMDGYTKND